MRMKVRMLIRHLKVKIYSYILCIMSKIRHYLHLTPLSLSDLEDQAAHYRAVVAGAAVH